MNNIITNGDRFRGQQTHPMDPAPIIFQMRKPQVRKKRQISQQPSATFGQSSEIKGFELKAIGGGLNERKIEALLKANQQLKESKETLSAQIEELKKRLCFVEMERDRALQLWLFAKNNLSKQSDCVFTIEKRLHCQSTANARQIALINKRIRTLALNSRMYVVASTQTDPILETEDKQSEGVQTLQELNQEHIFDIIRADDKQLAEYIAEIIHEKALAEREHKREIFELEQRLKRDYDAKIGKLRDDKLKQLEELSVFHCQQLNEICAKYLGEQEQQSELVCRLDVERQTLNEKVDQFEKEIRGLRSVMFKYESDCRVLRDENEALKNEVQKRRLESTVFQKKLASIKELKEKLTKSDDLKEIVLGEFRKLERERDALAKTLTNGIRRVEELNCDKTQRF